MKINSQPTVTVGIAAYNESKNIARVLRAVLDQSAHRFKLQQIIVADDGSTDDTLAVIKSVTDPRITIISDAQRLGKSGRVAQLLKAAQTDLLILLDADIFLATGTTLDALVAPLIDSPDVVLTSGAVLPLPGRTWFQNVLITGVQLWEKTCASQYGSGAYYCSGAVRALKRSFYTKLKFPKITAEDVYPYLYMRYHKLGEFAYVPQAQANYTVPSSIKDYLSQMRRYLTAIPEQAEYFDPAWVAQQFPIGLTDRLRVLGQEFCKRPLKIGLYLVVLIYARIVARLQPPAKGGVWQAVTSSK